MYIQQTKTPLDYLRVTKLRLLSMRSSMGQVTRKLEELSAELSEMERNLNKSSSTTHPLSLTLEKELVKLLKEAGSKDWTEGESQCVAAMQHLIHYYRGQEQS